MPVFLKPQWILPVGGVALAWVALFKLNAYWFELLTVSPYVGWIFLPAALRVLAVLVFKGRGVAGLFLGAMITNAPLLTDQLYQAVALSTMSAVAPALALWLGIRWFKLSPSLDGLSGSKLLALAGLAAVCSSLLHSLLFIWIKQDSQWKEAILPMTVGDFAGTLLVLYTAYFVMRWMRPKA